jgi:hypothetical protein
MREYCPIPHHYKAELKISREAGTQGVLFDEKTEARKSRDTDRLTF